MDDAFATNSASRYEHNWARFVTFVKQLDRKRRYFLAFPNTIIVFVQNLKNEGNAPIRTYLFVIVERHKTCRYPDPTYDYLVIKTVKNWSAHSLTLTSATPFPQGAASHH